MSKRSRLLALLAVLVCAGGGVAVLTSGSSTPQSATGSVHPSGWGSTPPGFVAPRTLTAIPSAEGFDTITLSSLAGLHPFALAGYTSGFWPTYLGLRAAFPSAHTLSIAINASHHADCLDVEPGDAVPSQAGSWARSDIAAGFSKPCLYSDLSNMSAVKSSLAGAGLARSRYVLWLAWYRNVPGLVAGYDIVQWTDHAYGRNLDEDTFALSALTVAQPPYVAPKPTPPLPWCYTHRRAASTCAAVKAKIASDQRAIAASRAALADKNKILTAYKCVKPYRRGVCVKNGAAAAVFAQRVSYFTADAKKLEAAN